MQPHLGYRVGRALTGAVLLTTLALGACKKDTTAPLSGPTGSYKGTLVGSIHSGVLIIVFPSQGASSVTGSYAITGGSTITLGGSYNSGGSPQLSVSGGGYTIVGSWSSSSDQFSGSSSGPSGDNGQWDVSGDAATVKVFCGSYAGAASGTWNLVLDKNNHLSGATSGGEQLSGTYSPGSSPNTSVTFSGGSASGNLNTSTGSGSGTWTAGASSGTWAASTGGC